MMLLDSDGQHCSQWAETSTYMELMKVPQTICMSIMMKGYSIGPPKMYRNVAVMIAAICMLLYQRLTLTRRQAYTPLPGQDQDGDIIASEEGSPLIH